jgi:hypothetical protein
MTMKNRRIPLMLVASVFGVVAWASVTLREEYQITMTVPFKLEGVPTGMAVKSPLPHSLQLRFRGDGWKLAGMTLGRKPGLVFSVTDLPTANRVIVFNDVAERLSLASGVRLVEMKPDSVRVELDRSVVKSVPVILNCTMSYREGYGQVGTVSVVPDSVSITGAESILRNITSWRTERKTFDDLKAPVAAEIPLAPAGTADLKFSANAVRVSINVEPFAEKVFYGVPVEVTSVPGNREVILIPPKIEVVVRAGIRQLATLTSADFHVTTDFERIVADTTGSIDVSINAPPGVQVVTKRPDHLQYIVRKQQ